MPKKLNQKKQPENISETIAPKATNNNLTLWLIIAILSLVLIGMIGFIAYDKYFSDAQIGLLDIFNISKDDGSEVGVVDNYQVPMGIFSQPEQQAQDPTANWKVFDFTMASSSEDNESSIYSFKYPDQFKVERNGDFVMLSDIATSSEVQLSVNFEQTDIDLIEWIKEFDEISSKAWEGKPSIEVVTSSDATFIELPAIVRQQKLLAADLFQYSLYFKKDDKVFSVSMMAPQITQEMINFYLVFVNTLKF
jgi:hypothetical protein